MLPLRVSRVTTETASLLVTVRRSLRVPELVRSALTELSDAPTDVSPVVVGPPPALSLPSWLVCLLTPTLKSAV